MKPSSKLALIAICCSLLFNSFTKRTEKIILYKFKYIGLTFTSGAVSNYHNWAYDNSAFCGDWDDQERPCTITVSIFQLENPFNPSAGLNSTIRINTCNSVSHYGDYVVDSGGEIIDFSNYDDTP
jgi:hypothetical protein